MASVVGICNRALQKLGARRIVAIDDDSVNARSCNNCYEELRDKLLAAHPWNFAVLRAELAADAVPPAFGRENSCQLPSDFLRLLNDYPEFAYLTRDYQIEGSKILTNESAPLHIRYVARVTDPNLMDPTFRDALASCMALEMCEELTQSNTKKAAIKDDYKDAITEARRTNAIQRPAQVTPEDPWLTVRR